MKKILILIFSAYSFIGLAQTSVPLYGLSTVSGTNTYTASLTPTPSLTNGLKFEAKFTNANTGASTLNINDSPDGGAITLRKNDGTALSSGDIPAGSVWWVTYDGTAAQFRLVGGTSSSTGGTVTSVTGDGVDNTDPANPVLTFPTPSAIGAQSVDSDLTTIAGLSPSNDDIIQRKAGAWTNRTIAQYKSDLSLSGTNTGDQDLSGYVQSTRTISTTSPLTGGGDLSTNRTFAINNAEADGSTKGAATFTAADFNGSSGNISLDYTNGQAAATGVKGYLTGTDWDTFNGKQAALVSGTNIKTVNSSSLLGSGNLAVGDALVANPLSQFASTTSAQLRGVLSDELGTGAALFDGATPTAIDISNATGTINGTSGHPLIISNGQNSDYTLVLGDAGKIIEISKTSASNLTVPPNSSVAFATGTIIWVRRTDNTSGALITFVQGSGVTITASSGSLTDAGYNVTQYLRKTGTNTWDLQNGAPGTWQPWTITFTGFSADPGSVTARYSLIGKTCSIYVNMGSNGTSNATTFTITLPFTAANTVQQFSCSNISLDNGTVQTTPGRIETTANSNVASLFKACLNGSTWTNSGGKRAFISFTYEIL